MPWGSKRSNQNLGRDSPYFLKYQKVKQKFGQHFPPILKNQTKLVASSAMSQFGTS